MTTTPVYAAATAVTEAKRREEIERELHRFDWDSVLVDIEAVAADLFPVWMRVRVSFHRHQDGDGEIVISPTVSGGDYFAVSVSYDAGDWIWVWPEGPEIDAEGHDLDMGCADTAVDALHAALDAIAATGNLPPSMPGATPPPARIVALGAGRAS